MKEKHEYCHCLHHPSIFHHSAGNTLAIMSERDICREKEARIDEGGRDYIPFIMVELIKKGRSLFISGEYRERVGPIFSLYSCGWLTR